jgi:hypothetical protein
VVERQDADDMPALFGIEKIGVPEWARSPAARAWRTGLVGQDIGVPRRFHAIVEKR